MVIVAGAVSGQHVYIESGAYPASGAGVVVQSGIRVITQSGVYPASGVGVTIQSGLHLVSGSDVLGKTIITDGETDATLVDITNLNVRDLLEEILKELKKQSLQLNLITDNEISKEDLTG